MATYWFDYQQTVSMTDIIEADSLEEAVRKFVANDYVSSQSAGGGDADLDFIEITHGDQTVHGSIRNDQFVEGE